jgi:hypothetical protein
VSGGPLGGGPMTGGDGGAPAENTSCKVTNDHASIRVTAPDGSPIDCSTASWDGGAPTVLQGAITEVTDTSFTLDSCPPNADCISRLTKFEVHAFDLRLRVDPGSFVRVEYQIGRFFSCQQALEVRSLSEWGGVVGPNVPNNDTLLFAVADGGGPFADSPYTVERFAVPCESDVDAGSGCGSVPPGNYAFAFAPKGQPEKTVRLFMGETGIVDLETGGHGIITARNLRSYQTGACDDYWNFAYYLQWFPD